MQRVHSSNYMNNYVCEVLHMLHKLAYVVSCEVTLYVVSGKRWIHVSWSIIVVDIACCDVPSPRIASNMASFPGCIAEWHVVIFLLLMTPGHAEWHVDTLWSTSRYYLVWVATWVLLYLA